MMQVVSAKHTKNKKQSSEWILLSKKVNCGLNIYL